MTEGTEKKLTGMGRGTRIDNKATILGNADGTPFTINGKQVWIAVLDAAYRGASIKFGTYGTDTSLLNLSGSWGTMTHGESETAMDARAAAEVNDSTFNCNVWMTYTGHTDTQSIKGVGDTVLFIEKVKNGIFEKTLRIPRTILERRNVVFTQAC